MNFKPLQTNTLSDYLHFMENIAFADNPDWSDCFCCCYHVKNSEEWMRRSREENKRDCQFWAQTGKLSGLLAYIQKQPVAWVNVNAKIHYDHLLGWEGFTGSDDKETGSIVCFVVDHRHRKKGIASSLLEKACEKLTQDGFKYVEAYPRKNMKGDAHNFHGPLSMYEKAGFEIIREAGKGTLIVRKLLNS